MGQKGLHSPYCIRRSLGKGLSTLNQSFSIGGYCTPGMSTCLVLVISFLHLVNNLPHSLFDLYGVQTSTLFPQPSGFCLAICPVYFHRVECPLYFLFGLLYFVYWYNFVFSFFFPLVILESCFFVYL